MKKSALILALLMCLAILAGCSNSSKQDTPADTPAAPEASTTEPVPEPEPDDQLAAIQKAGKLVVGVEGTYYPFTFHDEETNELTGYDIEVAEAVAAQMGVEVEFVESEWDSLLVALDTGRLDTVINDVTATDERREKYDFSENYFYSARSSRPATRWACTAWRI